MASTKSQGSSTNGRDSAGQRLGIKAFGSEKVTAGSILIRQRGTKIFPGRNVGMGSDHTIFSRIDGVVKFEWAAKGRQKVSVYPAETAKA
ncbi:MAG TPA: 50S ribosomal protein L27 [Elusimicrobiota bacterium]|nr:50S ribosomal protein L27 [Elusimicrobiota bacterium]